MHAEPLVARMAHLEGAFSQVNARLDSIDHRLDSMDRRFDQRFDQADTRYNWLLGTVIASGITMFATQIGTILTVLNHH